MRPTHPSRSRALCRMTAGLFLVAALWQYAVPAARAQDPPDVVWTNPGHGGTVNHVAFSTDGQTVASCAGDSALHTAAKEWRTLDGERLGMVAMPINVYIAAFSPDRTMVACVVNSTLYPIELRTYPGLALLKTLRGHTNYPRVVAFSPDGQWLASGGDDETVRVWELSTGALRWTGVEHSDRIKRVAFSPDSQTVASAGGFDKTVNLWRVADGALMRSLIGHTSSVDSVAFSPMGQELATGGGGEVRIWRLSDGTLLRRWASGYNDLAYSPDGTVLAAAGSGTTGNLKLWNPADGTLRHPLTGHTYSVQCVAISPDGQYLASGSEDGTLRVWRVADGTQMWPFTGHTSGVGWMAYSPDGSQLHSVDPSGDHRGNTLKSSSGADGVPLRSEGMAGTVLAVSPDGQTLVVKPATGNQADLRAMSDASLIRSLVGHTDTIRGAAFSPDGLFVFTGSADWTLRKWRVSDGAQIWSVTAHSASVNAVACHPTGTAVATGGNDSKVKIWTPDGAYVTTLVHPNWVDEVLFSPDGSLLASWSDPNIVMWRVSDWATVWRKDPGYTPFAPSLGFSPDGQLLAHAVYGPDLTFLRAVDGSVQQQIQDPYTHITRFCFRPDGRHYAYGRADGTVVVAYTSAGLGGPPVAHDQSVATNEDTARNITLTATDPDGDPVTFAIGAGPSHGTLTGTPPSVIYTPAANYNGEDSFTFRASDGRLLSNYATVRITVHPVNDAPKAVGDKAATIATRPVTVAVLANDTDVDGDALGVGALSRPAHGTATLNADGTVTYTAALGYAGTDSFTYRATDGTALSNLATVSVTIKRAVTLTLSPTSVTGGRPVTGKVTLGEAAPAGGAVVSLASPDADVVVPTTVTVPAALTYKTFTITTRPVTSQKVVVLSASYGGDLSSAKLTLAPNGVKSVSVVPSTVVGGGDSSLTVTLNAPAGSGGITVLLTSSSASARVPTQVVVPQGKTGAACRVATSLVSAKLSATLTAKATSNNVAKSAALTVMPITVQSLSLLPSTLIGGDSAIGVVVLSAPAAPGDQTVTITSSNAAVARPDTAQAIVPAGSTIGMFGISTSPVTATTSVPFQAALNLLVRQATLKVTP